MEVSAKKTINGEERSFTCEYDFGENLEEAIDKYGEETVKKVFDKQAKIKLQAFIRRKLKAGLSEEEIQKEVDNWELGVTQRKSKKEKILDVFDKLEADEKEAYIEKLIERSQSAEAEQEANQPRVG